MASIFICAYQIFASAQQPTQTELLNIVTSAARRFGNAADDPGPIATDLSYSIKSKTVARTMRRVAD